MNNTQLQSETISYLRFPLIVAVIMIHSYITPSTIQWLIKINGGGDYSIFQTFSFLVSEVITRVAVPFFFLSSGFLFFYNMKEWNVQTYEYKLKKRFRSLVIPYLFWNGLTLLFYYIAQSSPYSSHFFSAKDFLIRDYGLTDFLRAFWATPKEGCPILYPFWFIRDLIVLCVLSPLVLWLVRYLKVLGVVALGCCWFFNLLDVTGLFNPVAIFFFSYGAFFSINRINMVTTFQKWKLWPLLVYSLFVITDVLTKDSTMHLYIHNLGILLGIVGIFNLVSSGIRNRRLKVSAFLSNASFFVFACHEPALKFLKSMMFAIINPQSEVSLFVIYLCPLLIILAVVLTIYHLMRNYTPGFLGCISGGRMLPNK